MNAATEIEAIQVTRERIESVERRQPWRLEDSEATEERGRSRVDLFFSRIGRYIEENRIEPSDVM